MKDEQKALDMMCLEMQRSVEEEKGTKCMGVALLLCAYGLIMFVIGFFTCFFTFQS